MQTPWGPIGAHGGGALARRARPPACSRPCPWGSMGCHEKLIEASWWIHDGPIKPSGPWGAHGPVYAHRPLADFCFLTWRRGGPMGCHGGPWGVA